MILKLILNYYYLCNDVKWLQLALDRIQSRASEELALKLVGKCLLLFQEGPLPSNSSNSNNNKVHPRTGHEGPEGELMYSFTLSLTSALDVVEANATPRPLYPRERNPIPIV